MENDFDYECGTCGHRITVPFDRFYPPDICTECGDALSFVSKETIEENEKVNSRKSIRGNPND